MTLIGSQNVLFKIIYGYRYIHILLFINILISFNSTNAQVTYSPDSIGSSQSKFILESLRNETAPFSKKFLRGELTSLGIQIAGYIVIAALPEGTTNWDYKHIKENYVRAYTHPPVLDKDGWFFNYLGHPLTGAVHYNVWRSQGGKWWESFLYSTGQSLVWEYVVESMHEQPSIQDLALTSTLGSLIGEGFHQATVAMGNNGFSLPEKILVTIINPTYVINNGYGSVRKKRKLNRILD